MLFCVSTLKAQIFNPGNGIVFSETEIPKVHLLIHPDSLGELYLQENWYSNHEYPCTFIFEHSGGSDTLYDVGMRFRGNTARDKIKKSFRISFNTFVPGRRYEGLKKLNLNAEVNDPSMLRSNTGWSIYRDFEIAACRANYVEVYINNAYYGLYQNTEYINDDFVEGRFGDDAGNLYKCSYPADLNYISSNPDAYKLAPWGSRTYELITNEAIDDYSDLAAFIDFLNNADEEEFACRFSEYMDVYTYLKTLAVDVLSGNWDGYAYNMNNYYLYANPLTSRFEYLPYDLDNTWGIDWLGQNWSNRNVYNWSPQGNQRPLADRLLDIQEFRDVYTWYIRNMVQQYTQPFAFITEIEDKQDMIAASALADPYRPLDYDYSDDDFLNALTEAAGGHVDYSISGYLQNRNISALQQAAPIAIAPIIWEVRENFSGYPEMVEVVVKCQGPVWNTLELEYALNGVAQNPMVVSSYAEIHTFEIPLGAAFAQLTYNVTATGATGLLRYAYCEYRVITNNGGPTIVINEAMSSNDSTIDDEEGAFDDWIELHNYGPSPVNLDGLYLSDKNSSPRYWALPDLVMAPGSFLLIWADDEREQGTLHAPFKLSADGEDIFLFQEIENGLRLIDHVDMPALGTDQSWGRSEDAALPWVLFDDATPAASNGTLGVFGPGMDVKSHPYPNPAVDMLYLPVPGQYMLSDLSGKPVASGNGGIVNLSQIAAGIYLLQWERGVNKIVKY